MNRRLFLGTSLLALSIAASTPAPAAAETTLRIATMGEPKSLDPHFVSGTWENIVVGDFFTGLTTDAADASMIPGAAESWTISDDGLTYTFKLREQTWSDGTPLTAEDFVYSWRRLLDPANGAEYAYLLHVLKNGQAINEGKQTDPTALGAEAVDPRTLKVTLEYPAGYFLQQLTHYTAYPVPRHVIEAKGADWVKPGNIAVNGPFVPVEWSPHNRIVADKNTKFYDAANVKLDKVIYYPDEDRAAVAKRFRAGEIDWANDFASAEYETLKREIGEQAVISPYLGTYYYIFNGLKKPFDDVRVRRALSMAIERDAITQKILKTGEISAYGIVPPQTGTYGAGEKLAWAEMPYKERVAEAKKLLAEAGYGPDNPLKVELSYNTSENHKKIAVAVQAMWKPLGVQAELLNREVKVQYDALKQKQFEVARAAWIADYNDPQNFLALLETKTGPNNYGSYSNPEFDKLMAEQTRATDQAKRDELMHQAEKLALADEAWAPIYFYVSKNLVSSKLGGFVTNTKDWHRSRWIAIAAQ